MSDMSLTLYRNRKTGDCLIERFVGTYAVGKFMRVSTAEMQEQGLGIISKCLWGEPPSQSEEKPEMATYSKEEERAFRRLHQSVAIFSAERETIGIGVLRRQGSGYVVRKEDVIRLSLPSTNEQFLTALNQAFT
jgi:hypothetical protein